jgi:hypothetical protein
MAKQFSPFRHFKFSLLRYFATSLPRYLLLTILIVLTNTSSFPFSLSVAV